MKISINLAKTETNIKKKARVNLVGILKVIVSALCMLLILFIAPVNLNLGFGLGSFGLSLGFDGSINVNVIANAIEKTDSKLPVVNLPSTDLTSLEDLSKDLQAKGNYLPEINFGKIISTFKSTGSIGITFKEVISNLVKLSFSEILGNSKLLIELLVISLLCAILQNLQTSLNNSAVSSIAHYACFLIMALIIIKSFSMVVELSRDTISNMIELTNVMMPPLIGIIALSGGAVSAATIDPIIMVAIQITSDIIKDLILPMSILVVVLNIVDCLSENVRISKLAELLKQINLWAIGFIMTVFIGVITIRSSASATIDQVALKTTKFAIDNFIPVVGKCLSDAVATVAGYSLILKDTISLIGLVLMIFICAMPLIKIAIIALIYKFVGAVMEPVVDSRVVNCLSAVGGSLSIVFASVLSVAIMFFIMITIVASTGRLIMMVR
jgi:stage III sporulation protein AE